MAETRVSQLGVERAGRAPNPTTVSQFGLEHAGRTPNPTTLSQFGLEYVASRRTSTILTQWGVEVPHTQGPITPDETPGGGPFGTEATRVRAIRRLRQSPHISEEQQWLHYSRLQLDLEVGQGLTAGQGVDPQLMLQWSDDGGRTWSSEHWVGAGQIGAYKWRALWRRLGRSRNRVWRIVQSDPTKVAWIDAHMDLDQGTH